MKNYNSILKVCLVMITSFLFVSCDSDNDDNVIEVTAPATYEFLRDGVSTVSFLVKQQDLIKPMQFITH